MDDKKIIKPIKNSLIVQKVYKFVLNNGNIAFYCCSFLPSIKVFTECFFVDIRNDYIIMNNNNKLMSKNTFLSWSVQQFGEQINFY